MENSFEDYEIDIFDRQYDNYTTGKTKKEFKQAFRHQRSRKYGYRDNRSLEKQRSRIRRKDQYDSDLKVGQIGHSFKKKDIQQSKLDSTLSHEANRYINSLHSQNFRRKMRQEAVLIPPIRGTLDTKQAIAIAKEIEDSKKNCFRLDLWVKRLVAGYPMNFIQLILTYLSNDTCMELESVWRGIQYYSSNANRIFTSMVYSSIMQRKFMSQMKASASSPIPTNKLISVFGLKSGDLMDNFTTQALPDMTERSNFIPRQPRVWLDMLKCVDNIQEFKVRFHDFFTKKMLKNVTWESDGFKVVVTGGSVLASLRTSKDGNDYNSYVAGEQAIQCLPYTVQKHIRSYLEECPTTYNHEVTKYFDMKSWVNSDVDLYIVCKDESIVPMKIEQLVKEIVQCIPVDYQLIRTDNSITILPLYPYRPIQIVTTLLREISDHILFCDLDCTSFVYDPSANNVFTLERGVKSLKSSVNLVGPTQRISMNRIKKYLRRGFRAVCFEICKHYPRCDDVGTSKLRALYHSRKVICDDEGDDCEIQYDELDHLPYGPNFNNKDDVINVLNSKGITILNGFGDIQKILQDHPFSWKHTRVSNTIMRKCYQCESEMQDVATEVALCSTCKVLNRSKLNQWNSVEFSDANGNEKIYAIVTGGRNKIGYESALRLLRSGFHVLITTRFPRNALANYQNESDCSKWIGRLQIYGIDFRNLGLVNNFIKYVLDNIPRLHILINNAAQTIRRPRAYYKSILSEEIRLKQLQNRNGFEMDGASPLICDSDKVGSLSLIGKNGDICQLDSSEMSQIIVCKDDEEDENDQLFPISMVDEHGEQLDMREKTTWNQSIDDISTEEILEVQLINVTVPFMLLSQLLPIMELKRGGHDKNKFASRLEWSYIVNVTSQEGSFQKTYQNGYHVHTNMAKASLNMMTLSVAEKYLKKRIFICAVDPGWVTKMTNNVKAFGAEAPLSVKDGAARVLDPIYSHMLDHKFKYGVLYKHFKEAPW